ncbi:hypothetical protein [Microbulbifer mangrovi]|uniref:hypothetical protein n=1 Tax=Microbulbifer mangrovi TaxID=927787 RepID=UPI0009905804|nr:hypothetical protein [Microbulbifer mangrovi]
MKQLKIVLFGALIAMTFTAHASGSFRLQNGKLIQEGKSKQEIIYIAGAPLYQEVETIAIDEGLGGDPVKREVLTYRLPGDIGGMYLVVVTIENNKVVSVDSRQEGRL